LGEEKKPAKKPPARPKRRKNPRFKRQESWRYKRIKENWRKPRGLDNKMRKKARGWPPSPNKGYRNQKEVRGIHPSGFHERMVKNLRELEKVNPEFEAIRIAHTVGNKKRTEIVNRAKDIGIRILNLGEIKEIEEET